MFLLAVKIPTRPTIKLRRDAAEAPLLKQARGAGKPDLGIDHTVLHLNDSHRHIKWPLENNRRCYFCPKSLVIEVACHITGRSVTNVQLITIGFAVQQLSTYGARARPIRSATQ